MAATNYLRIYRFYFRFIIGNLLSQVTNAQPEQVSPLYEQTSEVNNLMVRYRAGYGNLDRFYVIQNSPERRQRLSGHRK